MNRNFAAAWAIFVELDLVWMGSLIAGAEVVMFAAFAASEDDFITFTGCHS